MKLAELHKGEKFIFKGHTYTKQRVVPSHSKTFEHDIFDCLDEHYRHRPFRDDTEVEPLQNRLSIPTHCKDDEKNDFYWGKFK